MKVSPTTTLGGGCYPILKRRKITMEVQGNLFKVTASKVVEQKVYPVH